MKNFCFKTEQTIRLDEFLRKNLSLQISNENFSNSKLRRLILAGAVFVNGKQIRRPAFELRGKSTVCVEYDEEKFFYEKQPDDIQFELTEKDVLFEDEYLIVVNKPAFFPVEQTITGQRDNLHDAVVRYLWNKNKSLRNPPYCGIMHRLDRETSGVILFTKQRCVNTQIHQMFENHDFKKLYIAVCATNKNVNYKKGQKFTIQKDIGRISSKTQKAKWGSLSKQKGGLDSKTEFEILNKFCKNNLNYFVVQADLFTGRTHQIRVHLSEEGLPLLGDTLYGGVQSERIMLHANLLQFIHPQTKEELKISAPVPFILE
ncbi:MAG: RluA family pseudouridine synthase [Treponema sp.]|jgi:23S rRNA pseudouridine1911/1915/1917 synthase|nr:RluA family pseudouridine synthase [Treponema sp.]